MAFWKKNQDVIESGLSQAIEDAILFGQVAEIDAVLERIKDADNFPEDLRNGLESLRHYRAHYGKDGEMEPKQWLQKQKVAVVESAWGAELLDMLKQLEESVRKQA